MESTWGEALARGALVQVTVPHTPLGGDPLSSTAPLAVIRGDPCHGMGLETWRKENSAHDLFDLCHTVTIKLPLLSRWEKKDERKGKRKRN